MYKVTFERAEAPDGTSYNDPPVNMKEITEADFAKSGFINASIVAMEYRQAYVMDDLKADDKCRKMMQLRMFWFADDTGIAMTTDYYKGKVRYFTFGCNHRFESKTFMTGKSYPCLNCKTVIKEFWMDLIVEDSGWFMDKTTSRPSRGISDYNRDIKFSRNLTDTEISKVLTFLNKNDCPGYTGVHISKLTNFCVRFRTCYDSSD